MKRYDAAVVGEIYVDHIFTGFAAWPQPGEEVFAKQYTQEVGGGGAITACALARLGRSVTLVGTVGSEELAWLGQRLSSFGVPTDQLRSGTGRTGVTVSVSAENDRSFFTYAGENVSLEDHLRSAAAVRVLTQARHVHFAMPLATSVASRLIPQLHAADCIVSLDVGHHAAWLSDPANRATCSEVDFFLPNEREAELLCDGDSDEYLEFTRRNKWVRGIVKLGARGAVMRYGSSICRVRSPSIDVVDTTGAGDAFDAGFIDGLLDGTDNEECLRRGCICGASSARFAGALRGLPNKKELLESHEQSYGT